MNYNFTLLLAIFRLNFISECTDRKTFSLLETSKNSNFFKYTETKNYFLWMFFFQGVTWSCVRYMFGEIQYGGRVTDDFDKRLLNTFCKVWFGDFMFQPNFVFYKGYIIPKCNKIAEWHEYINGLPMSDTPEVFGLHPNADIT